MLKKTLIAAALATTGLVAAPAFADRDGHRGYSHPGNHYGHYKHRDFRGYGHVYYAPAYVAPRIVYAPPPVAYYPAPVYSAPAPVYYPPLIAPGVSIRLNFPL